MEFDLVIANGTIIDGTGRARFRGEVGVWDGRIAAVARDGERLTGRETLEAAGLVVAPGFIDLHSHADWILPQPDHPHILAPLLLQGITTVIAGNCGFSPAPVTEAAVPRVDAISRVLRAQDFPYCWRSFGEFLEALSGGGLLLNAGFLAGHGTLRSVALSDPTGAPSPQEQETLSRLLRQSIDDGAFGLSAGLAYAPGVFAKNDELLALLRVVAEANALFTVHGRAYSWVSPFYRPMFFGPPHNLRSVRELIGLARASRARLQLSHQIFVGRRTWPTHKAVLAEIDRAAADLDLAFDAFPYTVGNSTVNVIFPEWFLNGFRRNIDDPAACRRLKREIDLLRLALGLDYADIRLLTAMAPELEPLEGLDFAAIAHRLDLPAFEAYLHVARLSRGNARILLGAYSGDERQEGPLQAALAHPLCAFVTDTILSGAGKHNPASFGTFPRLLGRYSRDLGLFSLEEAVQRSTSFSASRLGLKQIGRVAEGCWADLVVFDPTAVADRTTPTHADRTPAGIRAVLVSGRLAACDGAVLPGALHGRVLRR